MGGGLVRILSAQTGLAGTLAGSIATAAMAFTADAAFAANLRTLYSFCALRNCTDGSNPEGPVLRTRTGEIFGTTTMGGTNFAGVVFEITPAGSQSVIYDFCSLSNCADGSQPYSNLIADRNGDLYGVTQTGAAQAAGSGGTVFELMPNAGGTQWTLHVLYTFCSEANCADGQTPYTGLSYPGRERGDLYDGRSPLYGTTASGGANNAGLIFKLTEHSGERRETILHSFCASTNCSDGDGPQSTPIVDAHGNVFGTTSGGGNGGTFYELSPTGTKYAETVLYSFCQQQSCADGLGPGGALAMDSSGAFYGTTADRGARGSGALYKLVPNGVASTETVLYSFCTGLGCPDGWMPSGVAMDASGNLFGTTSNGGQTGFGVLFELAGGSESVLYTFCEKNIGGDCSDGGEPRSGVIVDEGAVFGTTTVDANNYGAGGTVFKLRIPAR